MTLLSYTACDVEIPAAAQKNFTIRVSVQDYRIGCKSNLTMTIRLENSHQPGMKQWPSGRNASREHEGSLPRTDGEPSLVSAHSS